MRIGIIGAGAMGGATVRGLIAAPQIDNHDIAVADPVADLTAYEAAGCSTSTDNMVVALLDNVDTVMVFVKPWLVQQVLEGIAEYMQYDRQTLVVVAAGVKGSDILTWATNSEGKQPRAMLCIPNIAIEQHASMTFLADINAGAERVEAMKGVFDLMGRTAIVEEKQLPAATTIASCGLAYAMRYIRAAVEGSVELGFRASDAQQIVQQTVLGAVNLLQATGLHPEAAIDRVTTPGGVTIKGLNEMEHAGFTSAVIRGLKAGAK